MSSQKKSNQLPQKATHPLKPQAFADIVLQWQALHGRHDLPWQQPATPYRVLVSEIMLQQTQVSTVIPYFQRWLQAFPDLHSLANAEEDQVMALWQGLGYYSRARNLQKAAQYLTQEYQGEFPNSLTELEQIPGVGRYTAGAIRSFAFDDYGPIVDGNVRRLFCRFFAIAGAPLSSAVNKQLWQLAEQFTPQNNNRAFAQGLLDLGATVCTPKKPNCNDCPLQSNCIAFQQSRVDEFPNPKPKKTIPLRQGHFIWRVENSQIWLQRRPESGIWARLWSLPEVDGVPKGASLVGEFQHTFSHYKLQAKVWQHDHTHLQEPDANYVDHHWLPLEALDSVGLPTPIRQFLQAQLQAER
ncbi:A/G-specific adenine glycosylase [Aliidiomarina haloalkalitolerans]|uniref:Adenine DNA glycosylase n=1 Tax=Aliidiomarina haloalkalitolerans TaxID=859059 RepID=A0A432VQK3_9GAMM|nr:A/G-specific adenine glycosylase [Aliidiomarina haloalkalitolerans]RUO18375.1 A/G-specific adenine glycosylase [Aliidiomarina haloalkalitolerans]